MKAIFTEVWAGQRYFINPQMEPTSLPLMARGGSRRVVLLDPGRKSWSPRRVLLHRGSGRGMQPPPELSESGGSRGSKHAALLAPVGTSH